MDNTRISFFSLLVAQSLVVIVAVFYLLPKGLNVFHHRALNEQQRDLQEQE
jgi:hypothetical protein